MTSHYRHRRSSDPAQTLIGLEPGEIHVNTSNRQLTVGDAAGGSLGVPLALLAIRIFDARGVYAINDYVTQDGTIFRCKTATGPGSFNPTHWDAIAGQQVGSFVLRSGDTMTGQLGLPTGPGPNHAVRRDYVDAAFAPYATTSSVTAAIAPLATTSYVNTRDALALPKAGGTMTGAIALPAGDPVDGTHAASKAYVDSKITVAVGTPAGAIMDFAMNAPPAGWFTCDGQAISRTDYAALFAAIGTIWGAGDGSTTFNLPNLGSRYRRHRDNDAGYAYVVGTYQSPCNLTHYHGVNITSSGHSADHAHYTSGTTAGSDRSLSHTHAGTLRSAAVTTGGFVGSSTNVYGNVSTTDAASTPDHLHAFGAWSGGANANHSHNVTGNTGTGSNDNGNEVRPYSATVLTCIKV